MVDYKQYTENEKLFNSLYDYIKKRYCKIPTDYLGWEWFLIGIFPQLAEYIGIRDFKAISGISNDSLCIQFSRCFAHYIIDKHDRLRKEV